MILMYNLYYKKINKEKDILKIFEIFSQAFDCFMLGLLSYYDIMEISKLVESKIGDLKNEN